MKQSEKSKLTYDKILNGAVEEFGTKSFDNASLNNICSNYNISKGLIYHNFKNKDELYLCCVELCFRDITEFLSSAEYNAEDINENIKKLMDLRHQFFRDNPYYSNIFFYTVLQPPKHLVDRIKQIRGDFDKFNAQQYKKIIKSVVLRNGISEEEALEYFFVLGEMFNEYFGNRMYENSDFNSLVIDHEMQISKLINIMLYGIAKEKE